MDVKKWLWDWFKMNSTENNAIEEKLQLNYIEEALIDSFGFIQLVADVEESFSIRFQDDDFNDSAFLTIEGLQKIIERKIAK